MWLILHASKWSVIASSQALHIETDKCKGMNGKVSYAFLHSYSSAGLFAIYASGPTKPQTHLILLGYKYRDLVYFVSISCPLHTFPIPLSWLSILVFLFPFSLKLLLWPKRHQRHNFIGLLGSTMSLIVNNVIINVCSLHFNRIFCCCRMRLPCGCSFFAYVGNFFPYCRFPSCMQQQQQQQSSCYHAMHIAVRNGNEWLLFCHPVLCLHSDTVAYYTCHMCIVEAWAPCFHGHICRVLECVFVLENCNFRLCWMTQKNIGMKSRYVIGYDSYS